MSKSDQPSMQAAATVPPASPNEVTALLIEVLRNVNREVKTTLALEGKADFAVKHFRAISIELRTLADDPITSSGPSPSIDAALQQPLS
jgi:hypothetical protein